MFQFLINSLTSRKRAELVSANSPATTYEVVEQPFALPQRLNQLLRPLRVRSVANSIDPSSRSNQLSFIYYFFFTGSVHVSCIYYCLCAGHLSLVSYRLSLMLYLDLSAHGQNVLAFRYVRILRGIFGTNRCFIFDLFLRRLKCTLGTWPPELQLKLCLLEKCYLLAMILKGKRQQRGRENKNSTTNRILEYKLVVL